MEPVTVEVNDSIALWRQWSNPADIFALLLLVGGDVVQKAVAQQCNPTALHLPNGRRINLAPVAFSFGWVAYAYSSLMSAVGDRRLMPPVPDCPSIVLNCSNAFARPNMSWILGRILRDHESRYEVDPRKVSVRIDIFDLVEKAPRRFDYVWWSGVLTILAQNAGFATVAWARYENKYVFLITFVGTLLSLLTAAIPQWSDEKWSGAFLQRQLQESKKTYDDESNKKPIPKPKVMALTRGNGSHHIMVIRGQGPVWDLETLAAGAPKVRPETPFLLGLLVIAWSALLISVTALKHHTWLLLGIGAMGMVQNLYAAGAGRHAEDFGINLVPAKEGIIIARRAPTETPQTSDKTPATKAVETETVDEEITTDDDERLKLHDGKENIQGGVMEALIELENRIPKAGLALLEVFFPSGLSFKSEKFRDSKAGDRDRAVFRHLFRRINKPVGVTRYRTSARIARANAEPANR